MTHLNENEFSNPIRITQRLTPPPPCLECLDPINQSSLANVSSLRNNPHAKDVERTGEKEQEHVERMGGPHAKSRPHLLRDMPPFTRERSPPSLKMRRYKKDRPPIQIRRLTSPNHSPQDLHRPKTPHDDSAAHVPHSHWSHVLVVVPWSYPVLFFFPSSGLPFLPCYRVYPVNILKTEGIFLLLSSIFFF